MPFISVHTNAKLSEAQKENFKSAIGEAVSLIPGKREELLMLEIEDEKTMYFKGKSDGIYAAVTVNCYKNAPFEDNRNFTRRVYEILEQQWNIADDHAYVIIIEVPTWGTRGDLKQ